jgi:hypothetical protein
MGSILFACIAKGKVICSSASAGGIAGANGDHCGFGGEISSCYSHASVECNQYAGGFIGQNMGYGKIIKSYSTGEVNYDPSISSNVGGFAGRHSSGYGQLLNCYFLNTAGPNNG